MTTPAQCAKCQAILEQLRTAFLEIEASPKLRDELRAYGGDFLEMVAARMPLLATDEDVDEVLGRFPFLSQRYGEFGIAMRRMVEHQIRTGHNVLFFKSSRIIGN
jgi:hypothetical protein